MNADDVMKWLEANTDARGVKNWNERVANTGGMRSVGIGLTKLRKYAKKIGRDAALSAELWTSDCYEARVLALLIDDPKTITRQQAERQVEELNGGMLTHVFSSCDATLAKAPFVQELADAWMSSDDPTRQDCGYGLLYELSKSKKKSAPDEAWFMGWVEHIDKNWQAADTRILMAMGGALLGVGKRTRALNTASLKVARDIGPIVFDPTGKCDPLNVEKHLVSDHVRRKLAI